MKGCTSGFLILTAIFSTALSFSSLAFGANVSTTVTTTAQAGLTQSSYRWYENENALTPTTALSAENTSTTVPNQGGVVRLRINLAAGASFSSGLTFNLQYSSSTTSGFVTVGTSTNWIFYDNGSVADGQSIVDLLLSGSDVGQSYAESNPSAATPSAFNVGEEGEWDWVLYNNSADTSLDWYFRMVFSSGTILDEYSRYPTLSGVSTATSTPGGGGTPSGGNVGVSPLGPPIIFPSSTPPRPEPPRPESPCDNIVIQRVDLSGDCRVDIVDLSILLYYYNRTGEEVARFDLNDNGLVDFPDVSVMMFYWTN